MQDIAASWTALLALSLIVVSVSSTVAQDEPPPEFHWINPLPDKAPANVEHGTFVSEDNDTEVGYCIYLPPDYSESDKRYPVVYWLHGGRPGSELKATSLVPDIDRHIRCGDVPPMIYVFPNGGRLSHYDHEGCFGEQAFLELIAHVDDGYRTISDRKARAVEGFSQGGRGTGRYMFKHANLFCSAAPMGGGHQHEQRISENDGVESDDVTIDPPGNNTWDLAVRFAEGDHPDLRILVVVGDEGFNYEANIAWHEHLESLNIDHDFIVVPGVPHSARRVYAEIGLQIMQFHADSFRAAGSLE